MQSQARFITPVGRGAADSLLRTEVRLDDGHGTVQAATITVTALGMIEPWINGSRVSQDLLTPGWTTYERRVRTSTYNVAQMIRGDVVVVGLILGEGWYTGRIGPEGGSAYYGDRPAAFADLRIVFADGHIHSIVTDESWTWHTSETLTSNLLDGQTIDARRHLIGWSSTGHNTALWGPVEAVVYDGLLEPMISPPVRTQEDVAPRAVWTSPSGRIMIDFGQNLVGWVRVRLSGEAGTEVVLRHAEVLEDGELGTRPLRSALATDRFILSGRTDVFEPRSTYHGFRYVEVTGWPGGIETVESDSLTAVVLHTDVRRTGSFSTSDALLDTLHQNVVWSFRGNAVALPTDCPQRDERLGWTGDIAVFAPTAAFLFDVEDFLGDWLRDLRLEQDRHNGVVPSVVPDLLTKLIPADSPAQEPTAFWGDAVAWVPWALWEAYGNRQILSDSVDSMIIHARLATALLSENGVWDTGFQFGDWLDPTAPPDEPLKAKADPGLVATAALHRTLTIVAGTCAVLGLVDEQREFAALAGKLRTSFVSVYVDGRRLTSDAPTSYTLAIAFGLLDDEDTAWAGDRLAALVAESGFRISTGFAGTPYILDALTSTGHLDTAYALLMQTECPSWLYPVTMGATTVWERWDSMLPDGSINPGEMTSFNHYALGSVADWMHRVIGGIAPLSPGYDRVLVHPRPGAGLTSATTAIETQHGQLRVQWVLDGTAFTIEVVVPDGVLATVRVDGFDDVELSTGTHLVSRSVSPRGSLPAGVGLS